MFNDFKLVLNIINVHYCCMYKKMKIRDVRDIENKFIKVVTNQVNTIL